MGVHCDTCTCSTEVNVGTYCDADVTQGHEHWDCLEWQGHELPHRGALVGGGCPNCDGRDWHAEHCPTPDLLDDPGGPLYEVTWDDDGRITFVPLVTQEGTT